MMKQKINRMFHDLFPIHRSLAGEGNRETLNYLQEIADFDLLEFPSGERVYDWVVPQEWKVNEAYVEDSDGNTIIDYSDTNLSVVSYSQPFFGTLSWGELKEHIYTIHDSTISPISVPYRTSYYSENWGLCVDRNSYNALDRRGEGEPYNIVIDTEFKDGAMNVGERILRGTSDKEYLFTTYCCHPSLANDNLSGMVLWALLLRELEGKNLNHTYRFVIAPETIGHIAYISSKEYEMSNIDGGYVLSTVAGVDFFSYRESFLRDSKVDIAAKLALENQIGFRLYPFDINGSDERQYSSPSFRIPMGAVCRSKYYEYDEYHTSLDNLSLISADSLLKTLYAYLDIVDILESEDKSYFSLNQSCEPMLGKRNLYPDVGGEIRPGSKEWLDAIKWIMFYSDGEHSLMDIMKESKIPIKELNRAAEVLEKKDLICRIN